MCQILQIDLIASRFLRSIRRAEVLVRSAFDSDNRIVEKAPFKYSVNRALARTARVASQQRQKRLTASLALKASTSRIDFVTRPLKKQEETT
jgi:hypothetical protein